jgi:hypothetical protein
MIRVNTELRDLLKDYAASEGRTLEWCANTAVEQFVMGDGIEKDRQEKLEAKRHIVTEGVKLGKLPKDSLPIQEDRPLNKDTKDYSLCKHGQVKGFCKQGCK